MIFFYAKINFAFFTKVGVGLISLSSLIRLIFNHQKAPLQCSIQLHTKFQLIPSNGLLCKHVSKVQSLYTQKNVCISMKLYTVCYVVTKIGTKICLYTPYKCIEFQQDQNTCLRVRADFVICAKRRRNKQ